MINKPSDSRGFEDLPSNDGFIVANRLMISLTKIGRAVTMATLATDLED